MCKSSICSHKAVHKPSQDCPSTSKCLSIALTSLRRLFVHGLSSPAFAMHHIPIDCLVVVHMPFDPTATVPKVNHRTGCHDKVTTRRPGRRGRSLKRFRAPGDMDVWSILLSILLQGCAQTCKHDHRIVILSRSLSELSLRHPRQPTSVDPGRKEQSGVSQPGALALVRRASFSV